MGPASKNIALYVTTCVSPHDGHMTSIGRLLVVISTGFPQRRHAIDIGADAGAWTGPGPGGGRAPRSKEAPATGAPPQPEDRDEQQEEQEAEDDRVDRDPADLGGEAGARGPDVDRLVLEGPRARLRRDDQEGSPPHAFRDLPVHDQLQHR